MIITLGKYSDRNLVYILVGRYFIICFKTMVPMKMGNYV